MVCLTALTGPAWSAPAGGGERVVLAYTGPLRGELEPCGCTADSDLGGILRLASAVDQLREGQGEAATFLIGTGGLFGTHLAAHDITNAFVRSGLSALGYDALGMQWSDLLYGETFAGEGGLPWVAGNWRDDAPWRPAASRAAGRAGVRLGVVGRLDPVDSPYRSKAPSAWRVLDDPAVLAARISDLRARVDLLVLIVDRPVDSLAGLPLDGVDVVLAPVAGDDFRAPAIHDGVILLQAGERGLSLGTAVLERSAEGRWRLVDSGTRPLDDTIADAPSLLGWYADYENALRADYEHRAMRTEQHGPYVGSEACTGCHATETKLWRESAHAGAYDSLVDVRKDFDPNCVLCHVVGYGTAGGFRNARDTPDLKHVGCEACHGGGRAHVRSWAAEPMDVHPVGAAHCRTCHTDRNSPGFDVGAGLSVIRHWR